ncbi:VOC family protein [Dyadobacter sp. CY312]|uniref:VOC family protein n=1 Tax=Dyadobacter sp. CY312 TaxID=2907303 RepID=UPI001F28B6B2|nr:VOC family protein [Dyadobacter sp. CY312]MCE7040159.1 VOC family protein [Dyadobacter sp. CY312]
MKINTYLNFNGTAEAAFNFYQSIFGGEISIQKMGNAPGSENFSESEKNLAMHVSLPIGNDILMASDCVESMGHKLIPGNYSYISLSPDSREEADRIFNALADGGEIEMPMDDMFWGDYFGSLKDKFGILWMINYNTASH